MQEYNEQTLDLTRIRSDQDGLDMERFPDFLILGPQRTGSTWLYDNLQQHPQVFLSDPKELYYFNCLMGKDQDCYFRSAYDPAITDLADYLEHFRDTPRQWFSKTISTFYKYGERYTPTHRGEASAHYALLPEEIIQEITSLQPDLKAILLIRNPLERAWSHAKKDLVRNANVRLEDVTDETFFEFFDQPYQRRCADYRTMIETWTKALKPGHLYIGFQKRITTDPETQLNEIHEFLGIRSGEKYINADALVSVSNPTDGTPPNDRIKQYLEKMFADETTWLADTFGDLI